MKESTYQLTDSRTPTSLLERTFNRHSKNTMTATTPRVPIRRSNMPRMFPSIERIKHFLHSGNDLFLQWINIDLASAFSNLELDRKW